MSDSEPEVIDVEAPRKKKYKSSNVIKRVEALDASRWLKSCGRGKDLQHHDQDHSRLARQGRGTEAKAVSVTLVAVAELLACNKAIICRKETGGSAAGRLSGGGRKLKDQELDDACVQWLREQSAKKVKVSRRMVIQYARQYLERKQVDEEEAVLKCSEEWLAKFIRRHNLTYRRATTVCQKIPEEYEKLVVDFILYLEQLREKENYGDYVYAADETAVWLDATGGQCITEKGAKEVAVLSTGHDKARITVMLTARSDGRKLKPYVLLPRVRKVDAIENKYSGRLHLCWMGTAWMNNEVVEAYLKKVFPKNPVAPVKKLLIWDAFRAHNSKDTKLLLRQLGLHTAVIPGGTTKFIQAPDVCWTAPFKAHLRKSYDDWMVDGDKEFTASGNPRAPSMDVYLQWVVDAWNSVSEEIIRNSFKVCGLTTPLDGSEDRMIHCLKPDGPIPNGTQLLIAKRVEQMAVEFEENVLIDPEQDDENGYVSDDGSVEL